MSRIFKHLAVRAWALYEASRILEKGALDAAGEYRTVVETYEAGLSWPAWPFTGWRRYALSAALVFWGMLELQQP